jgi:hypothetical protein
MGSSSFPRTLMERGRPIESEMKEWNLVGHVLHVLLFFFLFAVFLSSVALFFFLPLFLCHYKVESRMRFLNS